MTLFPIPVEEATAGPRPTDLDDDAKKAAKRFLDRVDQPDPR